MNIVPAAVLGTFLEGWVGASNMLLLLGNSFFSCFTEKLGQFMVPVFHSTRMCDQSSKCRCVLSVQEKQTIKSI